MTYARQDKTRARLSSSSPFSESITTEPSSRRVCTCALSLPAGERDADAVVLRDLENGLARLHGDGLARFAELHANAGVAAASGAGAAV